MHTTTDTNNAKALRALRREWSGYLLASVLFVAAWFSILFTQWSQNYALRWLLLTTGVAAYLFLFLWRNLDKNILKDGSGEVFPDLGLANGITVTRAVFNAALAGFLLVPWPQGWLAWAPSTFYLISAILDHIDGVAARLTGRTTVLGELMDMKWDGTGMFSAVLLSVLYGQAPVPFLLVGLARPLFVFGEWMRRRQNLPVYPFAFSWISRALAGMMMGYLAVVLMPVFTPPATQIVAVLFMLPFLFNFLRDWLVVSGVLASRPDSLPVQPSRLARVYRNLLPLGLRVALILLLASLLVYQLNLPAPLLGIILVAGLAIPALLLGVAGRIFALAVLLMAGFGFQLAPTEWRYWLILLVSAALFLSGTGRFSLWKPEEWLIYHRFGDRPRAGGAS